MTGIDTRDEDIEKLIEVAKEMSDKEFDKLLEEAKVKEDL